MFRLGILLFAAMFCALPCHSFEIKNEWIYPKIITPNGDNRNDRFFIRFTNPYDNEIQAAVYSLRGTKIAVLPIAATEDYFYWDGTDTSGNTVDAGAYLFQVSGEGEIFNGVVIVAR